MQKPDFFIVGAPKSGMTAMDSYLAEHPEIFMAPKELHFFGSDLGLQRLGRDAYLQLFADAPPYRRAGETSVWYLYSDRAAQEIKEFSPEAQIVAILRNPVEMLYALHSQFLYNGNEDITDFREALSAEAARKAGMRIPPTAHFVPGLQYTETPRYSDQLRRYFSTFGRDNVLVLIFDDFQRDPRASYETTLRFLDVPSDGRAEFGVVNPNKRVRGQRAVQLVRNPPRAVSRAARVIVPSRRWRQAARRRFVSRMWTFSPRPSMDDDTRARLRREFQREVQDLSELLQRDLTHWVEPSDQRLAQ